MERFNQTKFHFYKGTQMDTTKNTKTRKYFDSADYQIYGIAFPPHPKLFVATRKTNVTSLTKTTFIKKDRKFFDSAEFVLHGEIYPPHPNYS